MPKLHSLESILQPINRLPKDIFVLIPHFFGGGNDSWSYSHFPMNEHLITMTHVCRSWRNVLLSLPRAFGRRLTSACLPSLNKRKVSFVGQGLNSSISFNSSTVIITWNPSFPSRSAISFASSRWRLGRPYLTSENYCETSRHRRQS